LGNRNPFRETTGPPVVAVKEERAAAKGRLSYRGFSADVEQLASRWHATALAAEAWKPNGRTFQGESGSIGVTNGVRNDVAKPGKKLQGGNERICYATHEKIVSDLAFQLGLPVPPVVLWHRADATDVQWPWCSISAWAFPGARMFSELNATIPPEHRGTAREALSAMVAFDAWVGVEDRNTGNLIVDGDYKSPQPAACIDYCWSLSKHWTKGSYPRTFIDAYTGSLGGLSVDGRPTKAPMLLVMLEHRP
jgi:hypothetical protein